MLSNCFSLYFTFLLIKTELYSKAHYFSWLTQIIKVNYFPINNVGINIPLFSKGD